LDGANGYSQAPSAVWFNGDFTVEGWVYARSFNSWSRFIDFANGQNLDNVYLAFSAGTSGQPAMGVFINSGNPVIEATQPIPTNQWVHLAATVRGTTGTIYTNGMVAVTGTVNAAPNVTRTNNYIGRSAYPQDGYANAIFDDIRIWNVARTQAQIQAFMHHNLTGTETNLIGYWRLDENLATNAADSTTNSHPLQILGGATWTNSTAPLNSGAGTALEFANASSSYAYVTNTNGFNTLPITLSGWIKTSGNNAGLISKYSDTSGDGYILFLNQGYPYGTYAHDGSTQTVIQDHLGTLNDGNWHQLVFVATSSGSTLYVDGQFRDSAGWLGIGPNVAITNNLQVALGNSPHLSGGQEGDVVVDEVSIWNIALTSTQVSNYFRRPLSGAEAGLLAYYRLDEGSNSFFLDASGNNRNGSISGSQYSWVPSAVPFYVQTPPTMGTVTPSMFASNLTLTGTVNPNGNNTVTWFQSGPTVLYGNTTLSNAVGSGTNSVAISNSFTGLVPGHVYHYRAYATNLTGPSTSGDALIQSPTLALNGANPLTVAQNTYLDPGVTLTTPPLAAVSGGRHDLALKADGTISGWGDNTFGDEYSAPAGVSNLIAVAAGAYFSGAIKNDGTVVTWGASFNGLNGLQPAGLTNMTAIGIGSADYCVALKKDGSVTAWGDNTYGETMIPSAATNVVAIAAGDNHVLVLRADGTVVAWGNSASGATNVPAGLSNVVAVAAGASISMALKSDGTVVGWGDNTYHDLDALPGLSNVAGIAAGYPFTAVVYQNGSVQVFTTFTGYGSANVPGDLTNAIALSASEENLVALKSDGTVDSWGYLNVIPALANVPAGLNQPTGAVTITSNLNTQVVGTYTVTYTTTNFLGASNAISRQVNVVPLIPPVAASSPATNVLPGSAMLNGTVNPNLADTQVSFQWGAPGGYGQMTPWVDLGSGTNLISTSASISGLQAGQPYHFRVVATNLGGTALGLDSLFEYPLLTLNGASSLTNAAGNPYTELGATVQALPIGLSGGVNHVLALKADGSVVAWGDNSLGETNVPSTLRTVSAVAAGSKYSLALKADSTVAQWGNVASYGSPPASLSNVVAIAASDNGFSLAVKTNGTIVAWGQSGVSSATNVPVNVTNVVAIAAGTDAGVALQANGTVRAWGNNSKGQTNVPGTLVGAVAVAAGDQFGLVLQSNGIVVQWGQNPAGVAVPAAATNVISICACSNHCLALRADSTVVAWGDNAKGESTVPGGLSNVVAIAAGDEFSLALLTNGTIVEWGRSTEGEGLIPSGLASESAGLFESGSVNTNVTGTFTLTYAVTNAFGIGTSVTRTVTEVLPPSATVATLPATTVSAATATLNGTINPNGGNSSWWFEWGPGMAYTNRTPATAAGSGTSTAAISANISGLQLGQTYHFRMIGSNAAGLGIGTDAYLQTPPVLALNGPSRITNYVGAPFNDPGAVASAIPIAVSAGYREVAVLKADGQIVNWGSSASFTRPTAGLSNFVSVQSGQDYMIAVRNDGVPFGFGIFYGSIPTDVTNISAISVGDYAFADALLPNGSVLSWGMPFFSSVTNVPSDLTNVVAVSAAYYDSLALLSDGTVRGWGSPNGGDLTIPAGLSNVVSVGAGFDTSLALHDDGSITAWGVTSFTNGNPASITNAVFIYPTGDHILVLHSDGTVTAFGDDTDGESDVPPGLTNVIAISCQYYTSVALSGDGTLTYWGDTAYGQNAIPSGLSDLSGDIFVSGSVNTNSPGTYTITYAVTNVSGVGAVVTRTVTVVAPPAPPSVAGATVQGDGSLVLQFNGSSGVAYTLQSSTNLVDWNFAASLHAGSDGTFQYNIGPLTNSPALFFRLRYP
jgi:alpha-tubulin suppressor-like RCC1 family protein